VGVSVARCALCRLRGGLCCSGCLHPIPETESLFGAKVDHCPERLGKSARIVGSEGVLGLVELEEKAKHGDPFTPNAVERPGTQTAVTCHHPNPLAVDLHSGRDRVTSGMGHESTFEGMHHSLLDFPSPASIVTGEECLA